MGGIKYLCSSSVKCILETQARQVIIGLMPAQAPGRSWNSHQDCWINAATDKLSPGLGLIRPELTILKQDYSTQCPTWAATASHVLLL
jgi:hypothetical protein